MYSAQPNSADSATINPAALSSPGEFILFLVANILAMAGCRDAILSFVGACQLVPLGLTTAQAVAVGLSRDS